MKARDFHTKATRLIRSTGNASGRGRLKADLSEATTFFPRGLLLATGEQHPPGESIRARLYLVDVVREQIDLQRLTAAQRASACLPHALAGYVQWLAGKDAVRESLRDRFLALRGLAQAASQDHLRSPEGLAHLFLGFETGLLFAETAGACTAAERKRWHAAGWAALTAGAATTARDVAEAAPVKRFLTVLAMLLRQRRVTLGTRESDDTAPIPGSRPDAYVEMVGWLDPPDTWRDHVRRRLHGRGPGLPRVGGAVRDHEEPVDEEPGRVGAHDMRRGPNHDGHRVLLSQIR